MRSVSHAFERLWGEEERERLIGELRETMVGTAAALATALDERDDYTGDHARDIAELAVSLGERLGVPRRRPRRPPLRRDLPRHRQDRRARRDPQKAGCADRRERTVMQGHTEAGARILKPIAALDARAAARPSQPRAVGRGRVSSGARRSADPARRAHHRRRRRMARDDDRPRLPRRHDGCRSARGAARKTPAPSSTPRSSRASSPSSTSRGNSSGMGSDPERGV